MAALGDPSAALLLVNLDNANLLEGLEHAAVDLAGGVDVVGGAGTAVLGGSVDFAETADTDGLAEVDVTSDSGGANVEPVIRWLEVFVSMRGGRHTSQRPGEGARWKRRS